VNPGTYQATVEEATVGESKNGAAQIAIRLSTDAGNITSYQYIVKRDGEINMRTVENLMEVFGWDGKIDSLHSWIGKPCSIVVEDEEYNGRVSARVKWLNKPGGSAAASSVDTTSLQAKLNAALGIEYTARSVYDAFRDRCRIAGREAEANTLWKAWCAENGVSAETTDWLRVAMLVAKFDAMPQVPANEDEEIDF
jgi:hypothetical protein